MSRWTSDQASGYSGGIAVSPSGYQPAKGGERERGGMEEGREEGRDGGRVGEGGGGRKEEGR